VIALAILFFGGVELIQRDGAGIAWAFLVTITVCAVMAIQAAEASFSERSRK
jgi:hypothetical protein